MRARAPHGMKAVPILTTPSITLPPCGHLSAPNVHNSLEHTGEPLPANGTLRG
jgi:hypothetical protein